MSDKKTTPKASKQGSATDRLFSSTQNKETKTEQNQETESVEMVRKNFYVPLEYGDWLEEFCFKLKRTSGLRLSQSQVISKLIEILHYKDLDLSTIKDISDLEYHFSNTEKKK